MCVRLMEYMYNFAGIDRRSMCLLLSFWLTQILVFLCLKTNGFIRLMGQMECQIYIPNFSFGIFGSAFLCAAFILLAGENKLVICPFQLYLFVCLEKAIILIFPLIRHLIHLFWFLVCCFGIWTPTPSSSFFFLSSSF